jgi:hypothetical protein
LTPTRARIISATELSRDFGTKVLKEANARRTDHTLTAPIVFHTRDGEWYLRRIDHLDPYPDAMTIKGAGTFDPSSSTDDDVIIEVVLEKLTREAKINFV